MDSQNGARLPIFPLGQVLFPGMPLTLHIFEERYKQMLRDLKGTANRFVVALIREGVEVGGAADPHPIGCVAEVVQLQPLPGGTYLVRAVGRERVRIGPLDHESEPYLIASVSLLEEEPGAPEAHLVTRVSRTFEEYAKLLVSLTGETLETIELPEEPLTLSSLVASMLQVPAEKKQLLLELEGSAARLEAEAALLRVELPLLRALAGAAKPPENESSPFSLN
jgi:uncharacterized protein